jgi:hypothetical protein
MTANPNQQQQHAAASPVVEPFITKPEVARRLHKKVRTVDICHRTWRQRF